jgi:Protein of unknown function (DUF1570)
VPRATQEATMIDPRFGKMSFVRKGCVLPLAALLLVGCNSLQVDKEATEKTRASGASIAPISGPGKYHHRDSQYVFYSDFPLKTNLPLFKELADLREQVCRDLQLPPSDRIIQVFLFEDQERYEKFMHARHPELPLRRAFFIKQQRTAGGPDDLLVYTYWGENVRQDLRHELTHGILHSVLKDVPLWLDEGLAEYYELPGENHGINSAHLSELRKGSFAPDLARLEQLSEVKQMQRPEYREAWAWSHFMLRSRPEARAVLLAYLQQLRMTDKPGPLLPKLKEAFPTLNDSLIAYVEKLSTPRLARANDEKP